MSSHLNAALEAFRKQQAQKAAEAVQAATQPKVHIHESLSLVDFHTYPAHWHLQKTLCLPGVPCERFLLKQHIKARK